mmetsp:Transcript_33038/g.63453  ORF Transcript_33038/g.63453 Transcript_33038/m.63453 type:complete len:343 (-) Transcript_33038:383-1411(-)
MTEAFSKSVLLRRDGSPGPVSSTLASKVVLAYFSAGWCEPCKAFTPLLKVFYEQAHKSGDHLEIVFCSNDKSEEEMLEYFRNDHGDWLAVKHADPSIMKLASNLGVQGIPFLAVLNKSGEMVVSDGRMEVVQALRGGPPAVQECVLRWRKLVGDWTTGQSATTGGEVIAADDVASMRAARLRALEARAAAAPPAPTPAPKAAPLPTAPLCVQPLAAAPSPSPEPSRPPAPAAPASKPVPALAPTPAPPSSAQETANPPANQRVPSSPDNAIDAEQQLLEQALKLSLQQQDTDVSAKLDEERFAEQEQTMQEMGFVDKAANLRALNATNGNVEASIQQVLGIA